MGYRGYHGAFGAAGIAPHKRTIQACAAKTALKQVSHLIHSGKIDF